MRTFTGSDSPSALRLTGDSARNDTEGPEQEDSRTQQQTMSTAALRRRWLGGRILLDGAVRIRYSSRRGAVNGRQLKPMPTVGPLRMQCRSFGSAEASKERSRITGSVAPE